MRRADAIPILQPNKLEFPHPAAVQLDDEYIVVLCGYSLYFHYSIVMTIQAALIREE